MTYKPHVDRVWWFLACYEADRERCCPARNHTRELNLQDLRSQETHHRFILFESVPQRSIGLPDVHSGYGFAIGNMAAFDMSNPEAVVSPGT